MDQARVLRPRPIAPLITKARFRVRRRRGGVHNAKVLLILQVSLFRDDFFYGQGVNHHINAALAVQEMRRQRTGPPTKEFTQALRLSQYNLGDVAQPRISQNLRADIYSGQTCGFSTQAFRKMQVVPYPCLGLRFL